MSIKKVNGEEFEPSSLTNKLYSLDRHMGDAQGKPISLLKDAQFKRVREVLKAKRIDLRQHGKGQMPNNYQGFVAGGRNILGEGRLWYWDSIRDSVQHILFLYFDDGIERAI